MAPYNVYSSGIFDINFSTLQRLLHYMFPCTFKLN
jgi:hypothetical protein